MPWEVAREQVRQPFTITFPKSTANPTAESIRTLSQAPMAATRIAIRANGKILLVDAAEILSAEAQGNYVLLRKLDGSHLLRERISMLATKLEPYGLIRIHRSVLVNRAHVEGIKPLATGEYLLRMKGGKEYSVSRTYKRNLQHLAVVWIGMDGFADETSEQGMAQALTS